MIEVKDMILGTIGGLGFFLFGMGLMSDGLKKVAGQRLKSLLESLTKNRVIGLVVGACVTAILQSSSAVTVMVVGFVNAGLLTLKQALSVILGANIGTTITAAMVSISAVLKITNYALPMVGVGFLIQILAKKEKGKGLGEIILGFGTLFVGIYFLQQGFAPLQESPKVHQVLIHLGERPFLAVLAGMALTTLIQSSSASVAMIQMLAWQGAFGSDWHLVLQVVIPFVLGTNIGTTITAQLAALRASRNAKRAAMGHTLFNVIGVLYFLPLVYSGWYSRFIEWIVARDLSSNNIMLYIAVIHAVFNIFNAGVFLPFIGALETLVKKIIPINKQEQRQRPVVLEYHLLDTPSIALEQAKREIVRMAIIAREAVDHAMAGIIENRPDRLKPVKDLEDLTDTMQLEITSYLTALSRKQLSDEVAVELPVLLHTVNDLERVGDHANNIAQIAYRKIQQRIVFSTQGQEEAGQLRNEVDRMFDDAISALQTKDMEAARAAIVHENALNRMQVEFRRHHVNRMQKGISTAHAGVIFIDLVDNAEKIGDHLTNIAQAIIGGLQWTGVDPKIEQTK